MACPAFIAESRGKCDRFHAIGNARGGWIDIVPGLNGAWYTVTCRDKWQRHDARRDAVSTVEHWLS